MHVTGDCGVIVFGGAGVKPQPAFRSAPDNSHGVYETGPITGFAPPAPGPIELPHQSLVATCVLPAWPS